MREDALFQTGNEHRGELEALSGVHRHHGDGVALARKRIEVGAQRQPLEERGQGAAGELAVGALDLGSGLSGMLRRHGGGG